MEVHRVFQMWGPFGNAPLVARHDQRVAALFGELSKIVLRKARNLHLEIQLTCVLQKRCVLVDAMVDRRGKYLHRRPGMCNQSLEYSQISIGSGNCKSHCLVAPAADRAAMMASYGLRKKRYQVITWAPTS